MSSRPISANARCCSQTPAGVVQEVYGLLLAHYLVRVLMHEAAATQNGPAATVVYHDPENPALPPARVSGPLAQPSPLVPPAGTGDC